MLPVYTDLSDFRNEYFREELLHFTSQSQQAETSKG